MLISLREVQEPGGRTIHRIGTKDGRWGSGPKEECDDKTEISNDEMKGEWGDEAELDCGRPFVPSSRESWWPKAYTSTTFQEMIKSKPW